MSCIKVVMMLCRRTVTELLVSTSVINLFDTRVGLFCRRLNCVKNLIAHVVKVFAPFRLYRALLTQKAKKFYSV